MTAAERSASWWSAAHRPVVAAGLQRAVRALRQHHDVPLWVLVCAAAAPVLMTTAWLVAGALQPASYSPMRQTVSVMAGYAGSYRWIVTGGLFVVGFCYVLMAVGFGALGVPARIGLALVAVSSVGIALCPQPMHGATPQHDAFTAFGAVAISIWPALVVLRRRSEAARSATMRVPQVRMQGLRTRVPGLAFPGITSDAAWSALVGRRASALVTAIFLGMLVWVIAETQQGSALGLAERLVSSVDICWPFVVALGLRRRMPSPSGT